MILNRRPGQGNPCLGFQDLGRSGLLGIRILDRLSLIQNSEAPSDLRQGRNPQEGAVAGDRQIKLHRLLRPELLDLIRRHRRGMDDRGLQAGGKFFDLRHPVGQQRRGGHEEAGRRRPIVVGLSLHQQQRQNLDGLAEPHIIGKAGSKPQSRQQMHPLGADLLVGPQSPFQRRTRVDISAIGRAQRLQRLGQPGSRGHP
jgi:hypothetical protein